MSSHRSQAYAAEACKRRDEKSIQILRTRRAASAAALFDFPPSSSSSSSSQQTNLPPSSSNNLYVTVEEDTALAAGPVYPPVPARNSAASPPSSSGSSATVGGPSPSRPSGPTRSRPSNRRIPLHTQSSYLSVTSNRSMSIAGLSECNRESISTVWSSADIPVFLDSKRMPDWESGSHMHASANVFMRSPTDVGVTLPAAHDLRVDRHHSVKEDDEELQEVMSRSSTEGPRTVSSPLSSDGLDESPSRAFHKKQKSISSRPPPLIFAPVSSSRDNLSANLPYSVSDSSHLNMSSNGSQPAMPFRQMTRQRTPPDLYTEADKYFSKSYTMTPPLTTNALPKTCSPLLSNLPELAPHVVAPRLINQPQSRFSDNGPEDGTGLVVSPSFSVSRDSRSSAESSTLPDIDDSIVARLSPTSTQFSEASNRKGTNKATEDATEQPKYDFLRTSAMMAMRTKSPSVASCRSRVGSVFTKASADGAIFEIVHASSEKAAVSNSQMLPPRRSSLRARAKTVGAVDRPETIERSNGGSRRPSRSGIEVPTERYRRPSSTDDLPATKQEASHSPIQTGRNGSSARLNSSFASLQSLNDMSKCGRVSSTASSHMQVDATSQRGSVTKKSSSNSVAASRPKSKGANWASHLGQGLTMHIEQGAKKHVIKLNYLSYDPFGKAESLCLERPNTPGRPRSKSGPVDNEMPESVGLLEFAPSADSLATTHLIFQDTANSEAPVLKNLVVGDDFKADLISRQAVLAIGSVGTREVSGSERKGKNTWRFVYGVEECRFESGQACDGIKTLRPLSFFCSATLLDPSRAKKTRMLNMIRKQMGSRIESMPMSGQSSPSSSTPASKAASPQSRTARLETQGSLASLPLSRGNSSVSSTVSTQTTLVSPTGRPDLIPFKMTRPMLDAMKARNASMGAAVTGPMVISAPMVAEGNPLLSKPGRLLPSALASGPLADVRSASDASNVKSRRIADISVSSASPERPRRERATTTAAHLEDAGRRPTTASEEIKQAYLRRAATEAETFESLAAATRASFFPRNRLHQHQQHTQQQQQQQQQQQPMQHYQRRQLPQHYPQQRAAFECENILQYPSSTSSSTATAAAAMKAQINARRPSTSQVDTRASAKFNPHLTPISPLSLRKQRPNQAVTTATTTTTYDAPEGPYWL